MFSKVKINSLKSKMPGAFTAFMLIYLMCSNVQAQQTDVYYLKTEGTTRGSVAGSKVNYIAANDMYSAEPGQLKVKTNVALADKKVISLTTDPDNTLIYIDALYVISEIRVTDKSNNVIMERQNIGNNVVTVDMTLIKDGFYTLEIKSGK
jgi:hypothetical protein